jgi:hypothetical protein
MTNNEIIAAAASASNFDAKEFAAAAQKMTDTRAANIVVEGAFEFLAVKTGLSVHAVKDEVFGGNPGAVTMFVKLVRLGADAIKAYCPHLAA